MSKRKLRYLMILPAVAVLGVAVYFLTVLRALTVEVAQLRTDVPIQVFGLGTVEAQVLSKVGFEVGAALVEVTADHGDRVAKGAVLARLHAAEQQARVVKAQAGVVNAEAALKKAHAVADKARAVLAKRKHTNRRQQALRVKGTVSDDVAEEAQMEQDVADAELAIALSEVDVAQATLEDAKAQFAYEQVLLDHHVLTAPYDALVVARNKEIGTVMTPGEPLFTLVDPNTVWALGYVDESRAGDIRVGQPAEVRLRSLPGAAFQGQVARIGIESDRVSEERRVYVTCGQCPEPFFLGEQAEITVTSGVLPEALLVPETAVEGFDGTQGRVWTFEDGRLRRRPVRFGHRTLDAQLEITEGLPPGVQVILALQSGFREGRAATPVTEAGP